MEYQYLLFKEEDSVLTITINREDKLNALNFKVMEELAVAFTSLPVSARMIVLTGAGEKSFVAGADISEIATLDAASGKKVAESGQAIFSLIEKSKIPVIARVNGYALGGGCELAMACHMRVASENAIFAQPEINLGIIPGYGGTQRLPVLTNKGKAFEMILTGNKVSAQEALSLGLVNHVVPMEELDITVYKLASKIAAQPREVVQVAMEAIHAGFKHLDYSVEATQFGACTEKNAFAEGTKAFFEKRKPNFNE